MSNQQSNSTIETFKTLFAGAASEGHPITSALARVQHERAYFACLPLDGPEAIEEVVKLGGVDFKAGDIAVAAVRDFGTPPRAIYDWCEDVVLGLIQTWKDDGRLKRALATIGINPDAAAQMQCEHDDAIARERVEAYEVIGLARILWEFEDLPRDALDSIMNRNLGLDDEHNPLVRLARCILSFAWELVETEQPMARIIEIVEMHARGIIRQVCAVEEVTGDVTDPAIRLEAFAVWCADARARQQQRAAVRTVLSGQTVSYAMALEDMQSHSEARYEDEEGMVYAWVGGRLLYGVNHGTPRESENSEEANAEKRWKRVDPCTITEMHAFAVANERPTLTATDAVAAED